MQAISAVVGRRIYLAWLRLQYDDRAQDLVEFAILGATAAAIVSALFPQAISSNLTYIMRLVKSYLRSASGGQKTFTNFDN